MIIPRIVVPESTHCGMRVSATVPEIAVPEYSECPYEPRILYKEGFSTVSILVQDTMVNAPKPEVHDDFGFSEERTPILIDVLANDPVPFGQTYTIDSFTQPSGGVVTLEGTQLRYTPFSYFEGEDSFFYTVVNNLGGKNTAKVDLEVTPLYYRYASGSYPLEATDAITSTFSILGGTLGRMYYSTPIDGVEPALSILGGSYPYIVRYLSTSTSRDAITPDFSILGGSYPYTVRYLTLGTTGESGQNGAVFPDAVTSNFSILGGSYPVRVRYLTTSIVPEAITPTFSILGGSN